MARRSSATGNAKILVAEREYVVARDIKEILQRSGHEVVGCVTSGEEVIRQANEQKIDLLIIDISLDGKYSGIKTSELVRENRDIPIIFLTCSERSGKIDKGFPCLFITKPFAANNLRTSVEITLYSHNYHKTEQKKQEELIAQLTTDNESLKKENGLHAMNINELSSTNEHLITATFREREMKQRLSETLKELELTKENLESQNTKIRESINYAETIQGSILPESNTMRQLFPESFIYYVPKDVVSGDFPWLMDKGDDIYIAAVDCTGHGVPGAMMSFVGYFLLNEITGHRRILTPASVLERLHLGVVRTLRQDQESCKNARDGMDIALCKINLQKMELEYSGAHRPLYLLRDGELLQIKGDKHPIGGIQWKRKKKLEYAGSNAMENNGEAAGPSNSSFGLTMENNFRQFTNHKIKIKKGDSIFFFSDGLPDQFGGPEGLKYGPLRIRETIINNAHLNMSQMHDHFKHDYEAWSENSPQIDDVLLIGIGF